MSDDLLSQFNAAWDDAQGDDFASRMARKSLWASAQEWMPGELDAAVAEIVAAVEATALQQGE